MLITKALSDFSFNMIVSDVYVFVLTEPTI